MGTYQDEVLRAALPELLLVEDVGRVLALTLSGARKAITSGRCGPYSRIGRRLAVRREAFLAALRDRETDPQTEDTPRPPAAKARYLALLGRGAGR